MSAPAAVAPLEAVRAAWLARWPDALALWSPFTRLRPPTFCLTAEDEVHAGLTGSFAMIRLSDQSVVVSLRQVVELGLDGFALEVLGHEIGHHILCPADLADNARLIARVRRALPTVEEQAPSVANMYADLLINDRLQRSRALDMAGVYRALGGGEGKFWNFYLRTYEVLWSLPSGSLTTGAISPRTEGDAVLGARLVRSFASRWLAGAGRFGALCLPYLLEARHDEAPDAWKQWQDAVGAGAGGFPDGLTEIGAGEDEDPVHPSLDPELNDLVGTRAPVTATPEEVLAPPAEESRGSSGQFREPFEYGQLLAASGLVLDEHEVAVRYYRERAVQHLVPFPTRAAPQATDPLPEGVEPWDVGSPLEEIDWIESAMRSPILIPGATTVRREWGSSTGGEPDREPVDLDIYVDSSGSMPDPRHNVSYLSLAGAIVALSALRAGARVQATLWSGTREFITTNGFVRDEQQILRVLTGFFGGATAFPIHVVRDTYAARPADARPAHLLIVSDDGVTTMYDEDERGRPGREVINHALAQARGGATMVLNLWNELANDPRLVEAQQDGWDIHVVHDWEDLVAFAQAFARLAYASASTSAAAGGVGR